MEAESDGVWRVIVLPTVSPDLASILYAVPVQFVAYHTVVSKGMDVEMWISPETSPSR